MKYLIDANCFITPHQGYAPLDVALYLWKKLEELIRARKVLIIDKVKEEIVTNNDALSVWLNGILDKDSVFRVAEEKGASANVATLSQWAFNQDRTQSAKEKFTNQDKADIFLVAYAMTDNENYTIVSLERSNQNGKKEFKLPDVCSAFEIRCILLEDMFRELKETF